MKVFTALMIVVIGALNSAVAQEPVLYGVTANGNGGIFRYDSKDNTIKNTYRFKNSGVFDLNNMIRGNNGIIYGVAQGGPFGYGIIYSLDPATSRFKILKNFRDVDGSKPISLVQGRDGKLYGMTERSNRLSTAGVLFSFDPVSSAFDVILFLEDVQLFHSGELTIASDGIFYVLCRGFTNEMVCSYNPATGSFQKETTIPRDLSGQSGAMIEGTDGNLYGVTTSGGPNGEGSIFSYSLKSKEVIKLFDFNSETGTAPNGTLTLGSDQKFYSTTNQGGTSGYGTIFCFDPVTGSIKVIHNFDGINGGNNLRGLTEGNEGKLYGMALKGQDADIKGSVFYSIDKSGSNYKILRNFDHAPNYSIGSGGNLLVVANKIFGIATAEKTIPYPYIFSYESNNDLFQKIIETNQDKGFWPAGNLLQATDGRFYGVTLAGGAIGMGGLYSFNPATRLYTMLSHFNEQRGTKPVDGLVQAGNGKIYGLTTEGGRRNHGVIFCFDPDKSSYVILKSFKPDSWPLAGFGIGNDGKLYSTLRRKVARLTYEYVLFSIDPITNEYKEVLSEEHIGSIFVPASDGILYAFNNSEILSYNAKDNILKLFPLPESLIGSPDRIGSSQRLIEAADHNIYGINDRVIFSFEPASGSFTNQFSFPRLGLKEYLDFSDLLNASDGLFYGTTNILTYDSITLQATFKMGTLFSFNPLTKSFKELLDFNEYTGGGLGFGQLVELNTAIPPIVSITDKKMFEGETADLTVSLNRISMEAVTLNYHTVPGTANDGAKNPDFIAASGQVTIPPGEVSTTISVPLLEDELIETRETFTVVLQKANDALIQLGDSIGVINIKNGSAPIIPPGGEIISIGAITGKATETVKDELLIRASPNPSSEFFTLHIGSKVDRLSVTVTNLSGQIMDKFDGALKNSQLVFGHRYPAGSYFVRVVDGLKAKVITLVKTRK